jgi:hypothetical protein
MVQLLVLNPVENMVCLMANHNTALPDTNSNLQDNSPMCLDLQLQNIGKKLYNYLGR